MPHPGLPLAITLNTVPTVMIANLPAAVMGSMTQPCMIPVCVPGGPGVIMKGSATVMIGGRPAARVGDITQHAACVAPIPGLTGKILPPGAPTVIIGG